MFVTGSGAGPLKEPLGAKFVQEVNAVTMSVDRLHPDVGSVIELGGQDAKIIIYKESGGGDKRVKPFGCMPSSGVADGIHSLITAKYPEAIFCAVETTGDGRSTSRAGSRWTCSRPAQSGGGVSGNARGPGLDQKTAEKNLLRCRKSRTLHYPGANGKTAGTGATQLLEVAGRS